MEEIREGSLDVAPLWIHREGEVVEHSDWTVKGLSHPGCNMYSKAVRMDRWNWMEQSKESMSAANVLGNDAEGRFLVVSELG